MCSLYKHEYFIALSFMEIVNRLVALLMRLVRQTLMIDYSEWPCSKLIADRHQRSPYHP